MHGSRADFEVERRLDHAAALGPEVLQFQDEVLEGQTRHSGGGLYPSRVSDSRSCPSASAAARWSSRCRSAAARCRWSSWSSSTSCRFAAGGSFEAAAVAYPRAPAADTDIASASL